MYCLSLNNSHLNTIKKMNYIPVGLGTDKFDMEWTRDNSGNNISHKNKFYGENTFHYWIWKNHLKECFKEKWLGFCHYRRFWVKDPKISNFKDLKSNIIQEIPNEWNNYDVILGNEYFVNQTKISKIIKHGRKQLIKNPFVFFSRKTMTIKVHFDMYHGFGNLDKAIDLLDDNHREEFRKFVNSSTSFNPHIMFITKPKIADEWFKNLFSWLFKCEKIFKFNDLKGYDTKRLYAYLSERYLSFWFKRYTNYKVWPWRFLELDK